MNQNIRLMIRFLVENLIPDHFAPITPAYISDCEVWDQHVELWEIWEMLHWSTQSQICFEVSASLDECCLD